MSLIENIRKAKNAYSSAVGRSSGVVNSVEAFKNVLFNGHEEIIQTFEKLKQATDENAKLTAEIESLEAALEDADKEYADLKATLGEAKKSLPDEAHPRKKTVKKEG